MAMMTSNEIKNSLIPNPLQKIKRDKHVCGLKVCLADTTKIY